MKAKDQYATLITPGTKKVAICSRRIGTKDRLAVIATTNSETIADTIVEALNMRQGELNKLEVPAQRTLEEVRGALTVERNRVRDLQKDVRSLEIKEREVARDLASMTARANIAEKHAKELNIELDRVKAPTPA